MQGEVRGLKMDASASYVEAASLAEQLEEARREAAAAKAQAAAEGARRAVAEQACAAAQQALSAHHAELLALQGHLSRRRRSGAHQ